MKANGDCRPSLCFWLSSLIVGPLGVASGASTPPSTLWSSLWSCRPCSRYVIPAPITTELACVRAWQTQQCHFLLYPFNPEAGSSFSTQPEYSQNVTTPHYLRRYHLNHCKVWLVFLFPPLPLKVAKIMLVKHVTAYHLCSESSKICPLHSE